MMNAPDKYFTLEELSQYDGKNGQKTYIAYDGVVYDASDSFLWKGGRHFARHSAGKDLTSELKNAPHSEYMLLRLNAVGKLKE